MDYAKMDQSDVIVALKYQDKIHWYISDPEYWFMDQVRWAKDFADAGYETSIGINEYDDRFDIPVLDKKTVGLFQSGMAPYEVSKDRLTEMLRSRLPLSRWEQYEDLVPSLFVDFDSCYLYSMFREDQGIVNYVPETWIGRDSNFLERVPIEERYWIFDSKDFFVSLY